MLKVRIIPILTFNGFGLVKTKQFANPRMVGNPVQAARVYNSRGVDELIFLDIFASTQKRKQNLKIVKDVIKECFMPVGIGGGVKTLDDINDLLKVGADKVVIKTEALLRPEFIRESAHFFGSQCISVATDVIQNPQGEYRIHNTLGLDIPMDDFIKNVQDLGAGEIILTSVEHDGMMNGFDIPLIRAAEAHTRVPMVCVGGGGNMDHYRDLFTQTHCDAVGSASIFHFTQFTPLDIKKQLGALGKPVRI